MSSNLLSNTNIDNTLEHHTLQFEMSKSITNKNIVPLNLFFCFLMQNFEKKDTHFVITKYLFNKAEYNKTLYGFINILKEYYQKSKQKYIDRKLNYKYFLTIIRQICNSHKIHYSTKIVYNQSMYEIEYSIYLTNNILTCN